MRSVMKTPARTRLHGGGAAALRRVLSSISAAATLTFGVLGCGPGGVSAGGQLGTVTLSDGRCAGEEGPKAAHEIIHLPTQQVYVSGGARPISDAAWESLEQSFLPWQKNTTRNLLSVGGCFFRSPGMPSDCAGEACFSLAEASEYTWIYLAKVACTGCHPDDGACGAEDPIPPKGHVRVVDLMKCHELRFEGGIFELADPWGNTYVMHASAAADRDAQRTAVAKLSLPDGWAVTERPLAEPLVVAPRIRGGECHHTVVRDDQDNSYHQLTFSGTQQPLSAAGCSSP